MPPPDLRRLTSRYPAGEVHDATLEDLRAKYREIRALRLGDERDPRARMRALAARYPGALRELDELPMEAVEARIDALDRALGGDAAAPPWAETLGRYHGWMRVALRLKRATGAGRTREAAHAFLRSHRPAPGEPSRAELAERLDAILRPPGGRLSRYVLRRVAEELGRPVEELTSEAFPPSPTRARR